MYCKKCGAQIPDDAQVCSSCGERTNENIAAPSADNYSNNKVAMVVVFILSIVVALSPFIKMYYINVYEQEDFSVSGMLETTSEILGYGKDMGAEFHLSDIKVDEMSDEARVVFFIVVFDMIMFVIGFAELLVELIYIVSGKNGAEGKFWKAAISSLVAFFVANIIIFAAIMLINASLSNDFGTSVKMVGVHASFYVFQILAAAAYIIAHKKYGAWKKENK